MKDRLYGATLDRFTSRPVHWAREAAIAAVTIDTTLRHLPSVCILEPTPESSLGRSAPLRPNRTPFHRKDVLKTAAPKKALTFRSP